MIDAEDLVFMIFGIIIISQVITKELIYYSGTLLIMVTYMYGAKKILAILMGDQQEFFYKKMYGCFARRPKKVAVITR